MNILANQYTRQHTKALAGHQAIFDLIARATNTVSPVWPLKNFIAVNPLQGLEYLPFEQAVAIARQQHAIQNEQQDGREAVNRQMIKWCGAYFDEGQATFPIPERVKGFYYAFVQLVRFDKNLIRTQQDHALVKNLPESPIQAIEDSLRQLEIPSEDQEEFLRQSLEALPGWSGYVKWLELYPTQGNGVRASLIEYLAVRLVLTQLLWPAASAIPCAVQSTDLSSLTTAEQGFRQKLIPELLHNSQQELPTETVRPDAQFVFCIDVRSESFRRAIEQIGNYETLGFAGFFGIPVEIHPYGEQNAYASCPVLLNPKHHIREHADDSPETIRKHARGNRLLRLFKDSYTRLKYNFTTPFLLAETIGPVLGIKMVCKSLFPKVTAKFARLFRGGVVPEIQVKPCLEGISTTAQVDYVETVLRMLGLTAIESPFVIFCGHGSSTVNNAYGSALDCGACGGNHGGGNARILASILNNVMVRAHLTERGITIRPYTLFLGAEHNTTTDEVQFYLPRHATEWERQQLDVIKADLEQARSVNTGNRARTLGAACHHQHAIAETSRRSVDWAETRPEWGLARNAAFIVGSRRLTQSLDLEGRCFLHSYDWMNDPDGTQLTTILTAPMVVAQWINSQYLFSTLDPVNYGGGSKITQNITGKIGAMQGNASDLMHGLPYQSVYSKHGTPYHEPMRLLTVVHAPCTMLDGIIQSQAVLQKLFGNGWVNLVCIDPTDQRAYHLQRDFRWEAINPE